MAGWTHQKREAVELAFYKFLQKAYVDSKDAGHICLGENLYDGQVHLITEIFDALEADVHRIFVLKSRQLGISTLVRALTVFMLGLHKGLKGALVFDTAPNREEARTELEAMIHDLPAGLKFPLIKGSNREGLTLTNNSRILFKSAGVKKSKSSGTLGRSVGLAFATLSELCSFDNDEGLESFEQSLSDTNPDRLYIYESTARGFNSWNEMWEEAKRDPTHCRTVFLGWWSKSSQRIDRDETDFQRYGLQPPTDKELKKINAVREQYVVEVSPEQLAWIRRKMDPSAEREGDADVEYEGSTTRIQEQPWCVTAETRVGSDLGVVPICEAISTFQATRGRIIAGGITGKARIWHVRTKLGYNFFGTANHPIITAANERIDLSESMGARVRLQPPMLRVGEPYEISWREPPAVCKITVTPDLARFVGLFMGDGSASNTQKYKITEVSICCGAKDLDVVAECRRLFSEVFGVIAHENARDGWITVRTGIKHVFRTLERLGLLREDRVKTMRYVHVPEFIWRSPKHVVREFLSGLFEADGFNAYQTNRVALFSKYPEFIEDIQLLLLSFGITSRIYSAKKKNGEGRIYTGNQLELRTAEAIKFNEEIGFLSVRKKARYDSVAYVKTIAGSTRKRPVIVFEDEVCVVEDTGEVDNVYNLTVEGEHLFDANGILTHNTEEEAFQTTGAQFFPSENLTEQQHKYVSRDFKGYLFTPGAEFSRMMVHKARNIKETDLKIWEEPDPNGVYCFAVDPAFGENEHNDRSSIQIGRCYSDGIDQVGEYASPFPTPQQLAWILASLMGWYGGSDKSECRYILELNGPGASVFNEIKNLRQQMDSGYQRAEMEEKGLKNIFKNVRTFIYTRPDGMSAGQNYHFKTNLQLKIMIMNHLRDYVNTQLFRVRSTELITEMQSVTQEGDTIKAPGNKKDDRVVAAAFLVYYWQNSIRKSLITQNRSREAEQAKSRLSIQDQVGLFQQNMLQSFFDSKRRERIQARQRTMQMAWRHR